MRYTLTLLLSLLAFTTIEAASIETFAGVDSLRSSRYRITLSQGDNLSDTFVYEDSNKFASNKNHISQSNHWTNFSFEGEVTITVEIIAGVSGNYQVRPIDKGVDCSIEGNKISFTISRPEKLYLWSEDDDQNPLFIFANPIIERPDMSDPNLVYWGPGVHNIGKHYRLESGKTYFLDGGAYLKGSMLSEEDARDITVCGLGILSGEEIEHSGYKKSEFDRMALRLLGRGRTNFTVEGITIINPGQYCIQAYGGELHTSNVKCFGWWYETDGWVGGDHSTLKDSFFKVFDDIVKVYFDDLLIEDLTIYKQMNGAVFQFGWSSENSRNATARNIYVVKDDTSWNQPTMQGNRGFINTASGNERNRVSSFTVSNVKYDEDISYILGIRTKGRYDNITIKDLTVRGRQRFKSYLSGGDFSNITLENVTIGGKAITCDEDIDLHSGGNVESIVYR